MAMPATSGAMSPMGSTTAATSWNGPYTESGDLPQDPWGNPYRYNYPPMYTKSDFPDIWSAGPDLQDGTGDDVCSWTRTGERSS